MAFIELKGKKHGDRWDGHWVKDIPGINIIMASLYPNRCDAEVCISKELDITKLNKYIEEKNDSEQPYKTKLFHCIVAMMVRVCNERRNLNRFVQGGRIYERDKITVSFVAKRKFSDKAEESLVTYRAKATDTLDDVSKFILGEVTELRKPESEKKSVDSTIDSFAKLPRWILTPFIKFVRWLDLYGKQPRSLTAGDPAFSTILLSNLGSIGCPSVYHHLNNYGTNSIMGTIGSVRKKYELQADGSVKEKDIVDFQITADERIADGFYFAKSLKLLDYMCAHPEILDKEFQEEISEEVKTI